MSRGDGSGCDACHGRCCRQYVVPVSGWDVVRLARAERLPIDNFARLGVEEKKARGSVRLDSGEERFSLALQRRYARDGGPACVFLMQLDGYWRCGVYGHRPDTCRTYPTEMHHGAVRVRPDAICSAEAWNVAGMELPRWRRELMVMEFEWVIYDAVLARFNAEAGERGTDESLTEADYFAWLHAVYAAIDPIREAVGDEAWSATAPDLANAAAGRPGPAQDLLKDVVAAIGGAPSPVRQPV